ncbi:MAG: transposase [Vulcanimicrobiota bacterium]
MRKDEREMVPTKVKYPDDFKKRAVRLSQEEGKSVKELANELGIAPGTLCNWRRAAGVSTPRKGPEADEIRALKSKLEQVQLEKKQLEKEKKLAEIERDILKKATALFARDSK